MLRLQIRAQCQKRVKRFFSKRIKKNIAPRHVETRKNKCNNHKHTTCNLHNLHAIEWKKSGGSPSRHATILGIIYPASFQQVGTKVPWVALGSQQASMIQQVGHVGMLACCVACLATCLQGCLGVSNLGCWDPCFYLAWQVAGNGVYVQVTPQITKTQDQGLGS